jgi:hypothetical protein
VERMANISGLHYYTGPSHTSKSRRKILVKDAIDLIILNNQTFKKRVHSFSPSQKPFEVDSAFGGLGIYRMNYILKNCLMRLIFQERN